MRKYLIIVGILVFAASSFFKGGGRRPEDFEIPPGSAVLPLEKGEAYTLLFTGDIMLDRSVKIKNKKAGDSLHSFLLIASTTQAADLTIGNLEGPVTNRGVLSGSIYSFRFDPVDTVAALNFAGFDVVASANNHILDYGRIGLLDTIKNLRAGGIDVALDEPVIKIVGDPANGGALTQVAFLGFTNLYKGWFDEATAISQITELKSSGKADIVVVLFHGGTEYETHSNPEQREIAHALVDAGADLFIGTHSHVAQEVEKYKNSWIAYSLGNFIFDQNFSEETMRGLMVEATIEGKKVVDFKEIPIKLSPTFQPYIFKEI